MFKKSISLDKETFEKLELIKNFNGFSRSGLVCALIDNAFKMYAENDVFIAFCKERQKNDLLI